MKTLNGKKIVLGFVGIMFVAPQMSGGAAYPYLRIVGPPPLRFEAVAVQSPMFLAELALPKPKIAPQPPMPASQQTNNAAETQTIASPPPLLVPRPLPLQNPASDLLSVTPEIINTYFKPNRRDSDIDETNAYQPGQSIFVPAELGFMPPMSDRAMYISK